MWCQNFSQQKVKRKAEFFNVNFFSAFSCDENPSLSECNICFSGEDKFSLQLGAIQIIRDTLGGVETVSPNNTWGGREFGKM